VTDLDAINSRYDGVATARLEKGKIVLTDHITGEVRWNKYAYGHGTGTLRYTADNGVQQ
jgi:hypothetical protein